MIPRREDLAGVADFVAELALARRRRQRYLADSRCGRPFTHPRSPRQFDARGYLLVDTCPCLRPRGHDGGCVCEHQVQRLVYRVDADGREHYATRPLGQAHETARP
jgi:hypothetical protein